MEVSAAPLRRVRQEIYVAQDHALHGVGRDDVPDAAKTARQDGVVLRDVLGLGLHDPKEAVVQGLVVPTPNVLELDGRGHAGAVEELLNTASGDSLGLAHVSTHAE